MLFVLHDFLHVNYVPDCCLSITNKETLQDLDKWTRRFQNNGKWMDYLGSLDTQEVKSHCGVAQDGSVAHQRLSK